MDTSLKAHFGKKEEEAAPTTRTCPFCCSEVPIEATRCPHCTSELPPVEDESEDAAEENAEATAESAE